MGQTERPHGKDSAEPRSAFRRIRTAPWCALAGFMAPGAWAQTPDADEIMSDVRGFLGDAAELLFFVLLGIAYLVAAFLIIDGAVKVFKDREGGFTRFILGALVAMVMLMLTTFMVDTGQSGIGNIRG